MFLLLFLGKNSISELTQNLAGGARHSRRGPWTPRSREEGPPALGVRAEAEVLRFWRTILHLTHIENMSIRTVYLKYFYLKFYFKVHCSEP